MAEVAAFRDRLRQAGIPKILDLSFDIRRPSPEPRLDGCGMTIVNPPYALEAEMKTVLPALHAAAGGRPARGMVGQMAGRRVAVRACTPSPSSISYGLNGGNLSV